MANTVRPGLTYWMRPPQDTPMEDGTMPGEAGYIDPHAGAMEEWMNIPNKQGYSDSGYLEGGGGGGEMSKSGNIRRPIHKLQTLSGAAKKGAI